MKKLGAVLLVVFLLPVLPTLALAQMGRGGMGGGMGGGSMGLGRGMGPGQSMGSGMGSGMGSQGEMGQGPMNGGQMPLSYSRFTAVPSACSNRIPA